MQKVSERYIVEIDISDNGDAHMQVIQNVPGHMYKCIKVITGIEAIELHNKLTKEND